MRWRTIASAVALLAVFGACSVSGAPDRSAPVVMPVAVDVARQRGAISPLIRGFSGGVGRHVLRELGVTVNSWGGNPASRYNYEIGHAWNAGADWEYRNGDYGQSGDAARQFLAESEAGGAAVRLAVPTLGWIAKDADDDTCSFPTAAGCDGADGASCDDPGPVADPARANVPSTPAMVGAWIERLQSGGSSIPFVAMDNEPELWGHTHYDVHPWCTTYEEVLQRYLVYAEAVRAAAPAARLLGPVTCCWFDYWDRAPGTAEGRDVDYVAWFLDQVRRHDERTSVRSLDLLDVHYYPQSGVYNDDTDPETAARRLRSTRSLWDPTYTDESWIDVPIQFVRRMRETIEAEYPGTGLAISEWNFGADTTMNGALAIAEVLAIYGREGVDLAAYWQHPQPGSPGAFAFRMHGNYDGQGSSFGGVALDVGTPDVDVLGAYGALDAEAHRLRVLLVNKEPNKELVVPITVAGTFLEPGPAAIFRYSEAAPGEIVRRAVDIDASGLQLELPAYSITLVELRVAR